MAYFKRRRTERAVEQGHSEQKWQQKDVHDAQRRRGGRHEKTKNRCAAPESPKADGGPLLPTISGSRNKNGGAGDKMLWKNRRRFGYRVRQGQ